LNGKITLQDGRQVDIIGTKFIEEKFFLFENEEKKKKYFGRIIQYCDYDELEKRDMGKPVRREDLAISPRLSKILINLSLVKEGPVLDAFCGIGGVLFESLLQNIPVIGIDRDGDAIEGAKQNMVWGKFDKRNYQLIYNDSKKVRIQGAEVMASEPDLGQKRTKVPMLEVIKEQTTQFENLMIAVLNNFKPQVSGRFAFTAPYILTQQRGKRVGCDVLRIAEATGLKLVAGFPIKEFREDQIVAREIVVLEH